MADSPKEGDQLQSSGDVAALATGTALNDAAAVRAQAGVRTSKVQGADYDTVPTQQDLARSGYVLPDQHFSEPEELKRQKSNATGRDDSVHTGVDKDQEAFARKGTAKKTGKKRKSGPATNKGKTPRGSNK